MSYYFAKTLDLDFDAAMLAIGNPRLLEIANNVGEKLQAVIQSL